MLEPIRVVIDGTPVEVARGTSVAAALLILGRTGFRRSASGESRGPVCGMGVCYECRARVNGVAHERTCLITCEEGMEVETDA